MGFVCVSLYSLGLFCLSLFIVLPSCFISWRIQISCPAGFWALRSRCPLLHRGLPVRLASLSNLSAYTRLWYSWALSESNQQVRKMCWEAGSFYFQWLWTFTWEIQTSLAWLKEWLAFPPILPSVRPSVRLSGHLFTDGSPFPQIFLKRQQTWTHTKHSYTPLPHCAVSIVFLFSGNAWWPWDCWAILVHCRTKVLLGGHLPSH